MKVPGLADKLGTCSVSGRPRCPPTPGSATSGSPRDQETHPMAPVIELARKEGASYLFFGALIALTFLF